VSESSDRRAKGTALARKLLAGTPRGAKVPDKFLATTMEDLFGHAWQGEELSLQERSLITCAALVALNREPEQRLHFVGAKNVGLERSKIEGVISHLAFYAGWPCAVSAFRVLSEVWPEESADESAG
jgi:4-carboxymuconolactone decarboxylase